MTGVVGNNSNEVVEADRMLYSVWKPRWSASLITRDCVRRKRDSTVSIPIDVEVACYIGLKMLRFSTTKSSRSAWQDVRAQLQGSATSAPSGRIRPGCFDLANFVSCSGAWPYLEGRVTISGWGCSGGCQARARSSRNSRPCKFSPAFYCQALRDYCCRRASWKAKIR